VTTPAKSLPVLPGPHSTAEAIDRLLMAAASQIGYREGRNNDNAYGRWYGSPNVAWCAQFVSWCAAQAGYLGTIIPKHQYTPSGANWFKARDQLDRAPKANDRRKGTPRRGDIVYVWIASAGRIGHVGIVEKVLSGGRIQTIEGNTNTTGAAQGNGVYRLVRTVTGRLYFARPDYAAVVKPRPKPPASTAPGGDPGRVRLYSLSGLRAAATDDTLSHNYAAQRLTAISSLKFLGFSHTAYPPKGVTWSQHFRNAWRQWQRHLGYRGKDADGVPGETSARKFAARTGLRYLNK
jgi:hypothetical protein